MRAHRPPAPQAARAAAARLRNSRTQHRDQAPSPGELGDLAGKTPKEIIDEFVIPLPDAHPESLNRAHGDVLTAVSDGLVALLKDYYGRGPTQARPTTTTISSPVCCGCFLNASHTTDRPQEVSPAALSAPAEVPTLTSGTIARS